MEFQFRDETPSGTDHRDGRSEPLRPDQQATFGVPLLHVCVSTEIREYGKARGTKDACGRPAGVFLWPYGGADHIVSAPNQRVRDRAKQRS